MALSDLTVKDFAAVLASKSPAPGGGAASALVGALGSALTSMVANLTSGKEKYKDSESLAQEVLKEAAELQSSLLAMIDRDTQAFNMVAEVFKLPKETEEQKTARGRAMQTALKEAVKAPFAIMETCVAALRLHRRLVGNSNTAAASDLGVGALCLKAGLQGAWLNVKINLAGIKDATFVGEYEEKGRRLVDEGTAVADEIHRVVLESL